MREAKRGKRNSAVSLCNGGDVLAVEVNKQLEECNAPGVDDDGLDWTALKCNLWYQIQSSTTADWHVNNHNHHHTSQTQIESRFPFPRARTLLSSRAPGDPASSLVQNNRRREVRTIIAVMI